MSQKAYTKVFSPFGRVEPQNHEVPQFLRRKNSEKIMPDRDVPTQKVSTLYQSGLQASKSLY